jgi:hypothetical protein
MGRLQVEIRHGHDSGPAQWGAVVALIVLVLFAAAGHREIAAMLHEVLTIVEITLFSIVGVAVLAAVVVIAARARRVRRDRARRGPVIPVAPAYRVRIRPADDSRPALDEPRRPAATWPLPGEWDEITPRDGDDRRRYS